MADSKLTGLTELAATPTTGDMLYVVDDPGGTPLSKKITVDNLSNFVAADTQTFTNKTIDANGTGNSISNIDVADLANGTDGELITWSASAVPATVAVGTAGQVLTSGGAGVAPTFAAAAGGGIPYISVFAPGFESESTAWTIGETTGGTVTFDTQGVDMRAGTSSGSHASCTSTIMEQNISYLDDVFMSTRYSNVAVGTADMQFGVAVGSLISSAGSVDFTKDQMGFEYDEVSNVKTQYGSSGDGTTQEQTAITGVGAGNNGSALLTTGTSCKFYSAGVLDATHTTNIPDGGFGKTLSVAISNKNNADDGDITLFGYSVIGLRH